MRLVIATGNAGKLKELRELLAPPAFEVLPQSQFTTVSVEETGLSFVENAILKARHAAAASGLPAIADDSGLEVDALDGAPGIYSARYASEGASARHASEGASDEANLRKLLATLQAMPAAPRTARYQCALVFMRSSHDPSPLICQASWEGRIIDTPRGSGGFGYDPIFELGERGMTAAELPAAEKNLLSHRGKALRGLVAQLREKFPAGS